MHSSRAYSETRLCQLQSPRSKSHSQNGYVNAPHKYLTQLKWIFATSKIVGPLCDVQDTVMLIFLWLTDIIVGECPNYFPLLLELTEISAQQVRSDNIIYEFN
jgi:hypothetical protein